LPTIIIDGAVVVRAGVTDSVTFREQVVAIIFFILTFYRFFSASTDV
jgi:hypothetical protein